MIMINFEFISPTKIYFGKNQEEKIGEILNSYNFKKCLIVTGCSSAFKSGLIDKVKDKISKFPIESAIFSGIRVNPTIQNCKDCLKLAKEFKPDVLLAIGGGSVIDVAKNVSVNCFYDNNPFDFNLHKAVPTKALPIGVILTISAAGSELSNSCVIQDDDLKIKNGFNNDLVRPLFAIENPELTYTVSKEQTAYGVVDMIMHTFERYMVESNEIEPADDFALAVIKNIVKVAKKAYESPMDYDSRATLMLMSSLSHNDLTNIGKKKIMPLHALEHVISGCYPFVTHAAGLAVLFSSWCRYYIEFDIDKFDKLAKNIFGKTGEDKLQNGMFAIKQFEKLFEDLSMPKTFADLGISNPDIDKLVNVFSSDGTRIVGHHVKPMDKNVARKIFEGCI